MLDSMDAYAHDADLCMREFSIFDELVYTKYVNLKLGSVYDGSTLYHYSTFVPELVHFDRAQKNASICKGGLGRICKKVP